MKLTRLLSIVMCCLFSMLQASENILAPTVQLWLTPKPMGDAGAFSFLGEAGVRNFRGAGTYGVYFTPCARFKLSGEFLTQELSYHGLRHHHKEWVSQYAIGGEFEYLLSSSIFQSIDAGGYYSHAFQKHVSARRRIAGSDGASGYLGTKLKLWNCAFLSADVNYDHVHYHRKFQSDRMAKGWGGSLAFVQQFNKGISLGLDAELRHPFNLFGGRLNWSRSFANWGIDCGVFGSYTDGKKGVPNVTTVGIQLGFSFGPKSTKCCRAFEENKVDQCYSNLFCDLAGWVKKPAVHLPVVLATPDQQQQAAPSCSGSPTSIPIPFITVMPQDFTLEMAPYFFGENLTYSAANLPEVPVDASSASINPSTGVITITGYQQVITEITVTATNACGSTSQTFLLGRPG